MRSVCTGPPTGTRGACGAGTGAGAPGVPGIPLLAPTPSHYPRRWPPSRDWPVLPFQAAPERARRSPATADTDPRIRKRNRQHRWHRRSDAAALNESGATNETVAIYARVSTEDQAERATIQSQLDFLRRYVSLHELPVAGEYVDDGISGTVPLAGRPEGQRLLIDAEAGRFGAVLVYRVDRLGATCAPSWTPTMRSSGSGVAIRSGNGADRHQHAHRGVHLLATRIAGRAGEEHDCRAHESRAQPGRQQRRLYRGPIPIGYDLDAEKRYIASERIVEQLGVTEADMVRELFQRVAEGETHAKAEAIRLATLGIPNRQRYGPSASPQGLLIERPAPVALQHGAIHSP